MLSVFGGANLLATVFLLPILGVGMMRCALVIDVTRKPKIKDFFAGFLSFHAYLLSATVIVYALIIYYAFTFFQVEGIAALVLFAFLSGLYVASFFFAPYLIASGHTLNEAIKIGTFGLYENFGSVVISMILYSFIIMMSLLVFGLLIGFFLAVPIFIAIMNSIQRDVFEYK